MQDSQNNQNMQQGQPVEQPMQGQPMGQPMQQPVQGQPMGQPMQGQPMGQPNTTYNPNVSYNPNAQNYNSGFESDKDWLVTLLLCLFVGSLGAHRFYAGKTGTGILMLITLGGCGIWSIIDLIMVITGSFTDGNGNRIHSK